MPLSHSAPVGVDTTVPRVGDAFAVALRVLAAPEGLAAAKPSVSSVQRGPKNPRGSEDPSFALLYSPAQSGSAPRSPLELILDAVAQVARRVDGGAGRGMCAG